tara:strand:- start:114 stop:1490 length:1377 start_codon:yes stop_codon:yes gene_type:complete
MARNEYISSLYEKYGIPQDEAGTEYWLGEGGYESPLYVGLTQEQIEEDIAKNFETIANERNAVFNPITNFGQGQSGWNVEELPGATVYTENKPTSVYLNVPTEGAMKTLTGPDGLINYYNRKIYDQNIKNDALFGTVNEIRDINEQVRDREQYYEASLPSGKASNFREVLAPGNPNPYAEIRAASQSPESSSVENTQPTSERVYYERPEYEPEKDTHSHLYPDIRIPGSDDAKNMDKDRLTDFYNEWLGRDPDRGGEQYWLGNLKQGIEDWGSIEANILRGDEFQNRQGVQNAFREFFNRDATEEELDTYVGEGGVWGGGATDLSSARDLIYGGPAPALAPDPAPTTATTPAPTTATTPAPTETEESEAFISEFIPTLEDASYKYIRNEEGKKIAKNPFYNPFHDDEDQVLRWDPDAENPEMPSGFGQWEMGDAGDDPFNDYRKGGKRMAELREYLGY